MSECFDRKDPKGKTSGSVLHGLVFAQECALLVFFICTIQRKILVDELGILRNTGIHALVSPKCSTSWITPGPEFESGDSSLK
jgi:hypothetical protein